MDYEQFETLIDKIDDHAKDIGYTLDHLAADNHDCEYTDGSILDCLNRIAAALEKLAEIPTKENKVRVFQLTANGPAK